MRYKNRSLIILVAVASALELPPIGAGATTVTGETAFKRIAPLSPQALYDGWRASKILRKDVISSSGTSIGVVRNMLISQGRLHAIVMDMRGARGQAAFTFRIPQQFVKMALLPREVATKIAGGRSQALSRFAASPRASRKEFAITDLIGDHARLKTGALYGYVTDAVFSREGQLLAILVARAPRAGSGTFAFGFTTNSGTAWRPGSIDVSLPYDSMEQATGAAIPVDYSHFVVENRGSWAS